MTPEPYPTMLEEADALDVVAEKANRRGDYLYEALLKLQAATLRSQAIAAKSRSIAMGHHACNTPEYRASHPDLGEER
jgi:hypothetical protein